MNNDEARFLILLRLRGAWPYAVPAAGLRAQLEAGGARFTEAAFLEHLRSLADAALVSAERSELDPGTHVWRLTEKGRSWLAARGRGEAES
jgi:DNA-binding HxlR family transcriptional regulator